MGVQPIQEGNFMYEMTASVLMHDEGKRQTVLKCPADLRPMLGRGNGYITPGDGKRIREWVDNGGIIDPEIDRWRDIAILAASKGVDALKKVWDSDMPKHIKTALGVDFIATQKDVAAATDASKKKLTGNAAIDSLNAKPITAITDGDPENLY
jgi:hypothetical protein